MSSPGFPSTVTVRSPVLRASTVPSGRRSSRPKGLRRISILSRLAARLSASSSAGSSRRGIQPGAARRTSSWWTKNSTVLAASSMGPMLSGDQAGGPLRTIPTSSVHGLSARRRCTASVWRCRGPRPTTTPSAASGRRSRSTRCAASCLVVHSPHSVGASGPTSSNSSHNHCRSRRAQFVMIRGYGPFRCKRERRASGVPAASRSGCRREADRQAGRALDADGRSPGHVAVERQVG